MADPWDNDPSAPFNQTDEEVDEDDEADWAQRCDADDALTAEVPNGK